MTMTVTSDFHSTCFVAHNYVHGSRQARLAKWQACRDPYGDIVEMHLILFKARAEITTR